MCVCVCVCVCVFVYGEGGVGWAICIFEKCQSLNHKVS